MLEDIKINYIYCPYAVTKLEQHSSIKNSLLDSISKMPTSCQNNVGSEIISKTDWNLPRHIKRNYWPILEPSLTKTMSKVYKKLNITEFKYENSWFQQYYKNDYHTWHIHGDVNWTNIYYLELPNNETKTELLNEDNSILTPEVYEGAILTLPSIVWHRSPVNISDSRKTVIVFNTITPN